MLWRFGVGGGCLFESWAPRALWLLFGWADGWQYPTVLQPAQVACVPWGSLYFSLPVLFAVSKIAWRWGRPGLCLGLMAFPCVCVHCQGLWFPEQVKLCVRCSCFGGAQLISLRLAARPPAVTAVWHFFMSTNCRSWPVSFWTHQSPPPAQSVVASPVAARRLVGRMGRPAGYSPSCPLRSDCYCHQAPNTPAHEGR